MFPPTPSNEFESRGHTIRIQPPRTIHSDCNYSFDKRQISNCNLGFVGGATIFAFASLVCHFRICICIMLLVSICLLLKYNIPKALTLHYTVYSKAFRCWFAKPARFPKTV
jgi:hypothetical protein